LALSARVFHHRFRRLCTAATGVTGVILQTHNAWRSLVLGQKDAEEATGETTAQLADAPPPAQAGSFASKRNLSYPKLTLEDLH